jgi:hypothetical protein
MDDLLRGLVPARNAAIPAVHVSRPMLHPNIYRKRIIRTEGNPTAGQWVAVYHQQSDIQERDRDGNRIESRRESDEPSLFAYGIYNPRSEIAVRMY